jgi:hypothetical protein
MTWQFRPSWLRVCANRNFEKCFASGDQPCYVFQLSGTEVLLPPQARRQRASVSKARQGFVPVSVPASITDADSCRIIYPDNDRPAVAVICDANLRAESKRSMCGG